MTKARLELDIVAAVALSLLLLVAALVYTGSWLQAALGLPCCFFIPGYLLTVAVFPRRRMLSAVARVALSFVFSVLLLVITGLLLVISPLALGAVSILVSLVLIILILGGLAWHMRRRQGAADRHGIDSKPCMASLAAAWKGGSPAYRILVAFLVLVIIGGGVSYAITMTESPESQPYTAFYLLGENGRAAGYPAGLKVNETGLVSVGIENRQGSRAAYRLQVDINGSRYREPVSLTLEPGERRQEAVELTLATPGQNQLVEFRLFEEGEDTPDIRYLWVDVLE